MKAFLCLIFLTASCGFAQGNKWTVTLKVIDDTGQPVTNANAGVGSYFGPRTEEKDNATSIDGITDTNGLFTASHVAWGGLLSFVAEKNGYFDYYYC